jgi:hypothetical protein
VGLKVRVGPVVVEIERSGQTARGGIGGWPGPLQGVLVTRSKKSCSPLPSRNLSLSLSLSVCLAVSAFFV